MKMIKTTKEYGKDLVAICENEKKPVLNNMVKGNLLTPSEKEIQLVK